MNKNGNVTRLHLRQKLISAAAMLLVASVLMVSSTYAWFVLSTAPEVANIKTQVGANGALEVALLNEDSWKDLNLLDVGDVDESISASSASTNLTWGNLVDLGDSSYGMNQIVLNPSRLFIEANGVDEYAVSNTLLKTPIYSEDGRIKGLEQTAVAFVCGTGGSFTEEGHGVRAIGTSSTMSEFQMDKNAALSAILSSASAARKKASQSLYDSGNALASIVVKYAVSNQTEGFTKDDFRAILGLATGLKSALDEVEMGLRQVFIGFTATSDSGLDGEAYQAARAAALDPETSLSQLLATYPGAGTMVPNLSGYINKITGDQTLVQNAIDTCNAKINGASESFSWTEISANVGTLMDTDKMLVAGMTVTELQSRVFPDGSTTPDFGAAMDILSNGGITITVPSGSGLLSDVADFAGDYTAVVTVEQFSYGSIGPMNVDVMMNTATAANPLHLTDCSNNLRSAEVRDATGSTALTDFYGYAIDLAFRTNAENSNLMLQTTPQNRIYSGDDSNAAIQGAGSYMSFTTDADISVTKMVRLMQGLRVVFMDKAQNILAIGTLDCTLGKDAYEMLDVSDGGSSETYAYLKGSANGSYQLSDLISEAEYGVLPDTSSVTFPSSGEIKALLYLHEFSMTESDPELHGGEEGYYTGGTTIGALKSVQSITPLVADQATVVTALVYLDGTYVDNSMVAANATQSMTGTLNLQFASDAELFPAEITKLRQGDGEDTEEDDEPIEPESGEPQGG